MKMKINMKLLYTSILAAGLLSSALSVRAEDYVIDTEGMHAAIQFKIQHLGYSWLHGRFNNFGGTFKYDEAAPEKASVQLSIKTSSIDSNHAERDKHLRSDTFLNVEKYPEAKFVSTRYIPGKDGKGVLKGDFTLHGITRPIEIVIASVGAGNDPWGGYRRGFEGKAKFSLADYGIMENLGPKSKEVELILSIEGVRVKK
ncbi:Protein yceI precursor [hydrothermal vent metagenome]|uniref:Protein yceI n=1 Tax=hydrothermal vent metagenome TaxID=652676 RepID=A0A3B0W5X5_9ZZZZ